MFICHHADRQKISRTKIQKWLPGKQQVHQSWSPIINLSTSVDTRKSAQTYSKTHHTKLNTVSEQETGGRRRQREKERKREREVGRSTENKQQSREQIDECI